MKVKFLQEGDKRGPLLVKYMFYIHYRYHNEVQIGKQIKNILISNDLTEGLILGNYKRNCILCYRYHNKYFTTKIYNKI